MRTPRKRKFYKEPLLSGRVENLRRLNTHCSGDWTEIARSSLASTTPPFGIGIANRTRNGIWNKAAPYAAPVRSRQCTCSLDLALANSVPFTVVPKPSHLSNAIVASCSGFRMARLISKTTRYIRNNSVPTRRALFAHSHSKEPRGFFA
jgi:hypothetical protein